MTFWEEIRRSRLHESHNPMGQLGVVLTQRHLAEVFLGEVSGKGGRTLSLRPCVRGELYTNRGFGCGQHNSLEKDGLRQAELCPR